jgi:hypothetical protein
MKITAIKGLYNKIRKCVSEPETDMERRGHY